MAAEHQKQTTPPGVSSGWVYDPTPINSYKVWAFGRVLDVDGRICISSYLT